MSTRAQRLEKEYLRIMFTLSKTTHDKKDKIGAKALGGFIRALIDECPTMTLKTAKELFKIAEELEELR
jgi:hypothetical protein